MWAEGVIEIMFLMLFLFAMNMWVIFHLAGEMRKMKLDHARLRQGINDQLKTNRKVSVEAARRQVRDLRPFDADMELELDGKRAVVGARIRPKRNR